MLISIKLKKRVASLLLALFMMTVIPNVAHAFTNCDDQLQNCGTECWDYLYAIWDPILSTLCFDYCGAQ